MIGLGLSNNRVGHHKSLPQVLQKQNEIKSQAFSLFTTNKDSGNGTIIFSGYNAIYHDELATFDLNLPQSYIQ